MAYPMTDTNFPVFLSDQCCVTLPVLHIFVDGHEQNQSNRVCCFHFFDVSRVFKQSFVRGMKTNCCKIISGGPITFWAERACVYSIWAATQENQQCGLRQAQTQISLGSAQSDQSLRCPHRGSIDPKLSFKRLVKIMVRLGGCLDWSECSTGAQPHCWFSRVAAHMQADCDLWESIWWTRTWQYGW